MIKIGDIVHYVSYGTPGGEHLSTCRAAIVTDIRPDASLDLAVLNPTGLFFNLSTLHNESKHQGGTWHYPEEE
jgi:hypothetical protein